MRSSRTPPEGRRNGRSPRLAVGVPVGRSPPSSRHGTSGSGSGARASARPALGWSRSRAPKGKRAAPLARSASEPALRLSAARVHAAPDEDDGYPPSPPPPPLERPHTCFDVFAPDSSPFGRRSPSAASLAKLNPSEEAKVLVSVTVEGSVGPVKAMVRLGASVGEAIAAVVERYAREGRSPRLDPAAAHGFQLHHSHFSLESLNKNDKIGDVGGRNFYLHKNDGSNGLYLQDEELDANSSGSEISLSYGGQSSAAPYHYQVLTIVIKKLDKIGRRAKRIWKFITCNNCT